MTKPTDWKPGTLNDVLEHVDVRNEDRSVDLVLSVTERRGILPQSEVFNKRVATEDTSNYKVLWPLDIAWNPYLLWTGAIGQWLGDRPGVTSPVYPVFRVRDGQDARFWGMLLEGGVLTPYFDSRAIGSIARRRRTTMPVFEEAPTFIPPLPMQARIVEVIDAVDDQIAALEVETDSLLRVRNAALGDILSRGGEKWFSAPLSEVGMLSRGRRFVKSDYVESGMGCIHYGQIYTDYGASTTRTVTYLPESFRGSMSLAQPGDVIIAGTSENVEDVGKAVAWLGDDDVAVHDDCFIFRHDLDPKFVSYFFASLLFQHQKRRFTSETKVVRISAANLKKIVMPVPPRDEQERISGMADAVDAQVVALRAEAERLRRARVVLLSGLLDRTIDIESAELEV